MKSSLVAVPLLKKRLRRITSMGFENISVNDWNFTVFFTLHRSEKTAAFYTSELIHNERNPEWTSLEFPSHCQYLQEFQLFLWVKTSNSCRIFLQYDVHLDNSLLPDIQTSEIPSASNRLWIEMFGYRFTDSNEFNQHVKNNDERPLPFVNSYDRSSLFRMMNIIQAIHMEKQCSTNSLEKIQTCLQIHHDYLSKIKDRESRQTRVEYFKQFLISRKKNYSQQLESFREKQQQLNIRKRQYAENLSELIVDQQRIHSLTHYLNQSKSNLDRLSNFLVFRQKLLLQEISQYIYPIECDQQNQYSIVGIKLPVANDKIFETISNRDKEIIAAIEFSAHFILIISRLISYPLRYPIDYHRGSSIRIFDPTLEDDEFFLDPSFDPNGFRYGFQLLNRNIAQILYHFRLTKRRPDYRKTLENLMMFIEHFLHHQSAW